MKLPSLEGAMITIKSDQREAKKCYENSLKTKRGVFSVTTRPPREDGVTREEIVQENRPKPAGGVVEKEIGGKMFKLLNLVMFNVLKSPNPLKDVEASALLDVAVLV